MIKIDNFEVVGWEHAIRGMRNPMNSWDKGDSGWDASYPPPELRGTVTWAEHRKNYITVKEDSEYYGYDIGPNDQSLMMKLAKGGPVHAKYRRMITVYVDILAPLYWWKEFDTYKVGTVANSCSTMHKIHEKEFTLDDFSTEHLMDFNSQGIPYASNVPQIFNYREVFNMTIDALNNARDYYLENKDKKHWWQMIQLLPSSYNQKRTVMLNYEVLHNIYISRKNHKLDEWLEFCEWIKKLPYSEIITMEESENEVPEM